jgi:hypothetical protein
MKNNFPCIDIPEIKGTLELQEEIIRRTAHDG